MNKIQISLQERDILEKYGEAILEHASLLTENGFEYIVFENFDDFSIYLTFDIIHYGMDNQDVVNEIGRELYAIHDRIYYYE